MRAGELLGARVTAGEGHGLGAVHDIRLRRTPAGEITVAGVIVGPRAYGLRLGYVYGDVRRCTDEMVVPGGAAI